jgi:C4-dicarboxylate-specific signal transduction histidine kinase
MINADKGRLRQLLHNLVKNAIEAIRDGHGSTCGSAPAASTRLEPIASN